jgi:hypothetical protein
MSSRKFTSLQIVPAELENPVSLLAGIALMNSVRAFEAFPISIFVMSCGRRKAGRNKAEMPPSLLWLLRIGTERDWIDHCGK